MIILYHVVFIPVIASACFFFGAWWSSVGAVNKANEGESKQ